MTNEKIYKVTINQSIEIQSKNEDEAKQYIAENILDFINWNDVEVEELK